MLIAASVMNSALWIGRHVHGEDMADAARAAQPALARHDRRHQLVGVQAALHQRAGAAVAAQPHRGGIAASMRRLGLDQFAAVEADAGGRPPPPRSPRAARPGWAAWRHAHAPAAARAGCRGRRARPRPRSAAASRRAASQQPLEVTWRCRMMSARASGRSVDALGRQAHRHATFGHAAALAFERQRDDRAVLRAAGKSPCRHHDLSPAAGSIAKRDFLRQDIAARAGQAAGDEIQHDALHQQGMRSVWQHSRRAESGPPNSAATRSKPRSCSTCSEVADMPGAASRRDKPTSAPPSSRLLTSTSLASGRRVSQPPDQAEPTPYSHPTSYRRPRAVTRAEQTFAEFHQIDTDLAQRSPVGARVKPDGMKRTVHCAYAALWMASPTVAGRRWSKRRWRART